MNRQTVALRLLAALLLSRPALAQTDTAGATLGNTWGALLLGLLILIGVLVWRLQQQKRAYAGLLEALDTAGQALLCVDGERQIRHLNSQFRALDGVPADPKNLRDFPMAWKVWLDKHVRQALESGKSAPEALAFAPDENRPAMFLRLSAARMRDIRGEPGVLLWCESISASSESVSTALEREHTLRTRSQNFIQTLIDVIPRPVYVKDAEGRYILANESFCAMHGITRDKVIGHTVAELHIDTAHAQAIALEDARVMAGAPIFKEEFSASADKTGDDRFTIVSKQSCLNPEGQRVLVGTHIDITPWRIAERELNASVKREQDRHRGTQQFIQRLIDALPLPVCVRDRDSRHLHVNASFLDDAALTREQILGHRITDYIDNPERSEASLREDQAALAGRNIFEERHNTGLNGQDVRDLIISKRSCLDVDGQPVIVVAHINVTAQREAERQALNLMNNEKSLRTRTQDFIQRLIDIIPHPFFVKDQHSRYILVNAALVKEFQRPATEILGRSTRDIYVDPDRARAIIEEDQSVLNGVSIYEERHEAAPPGSNHWVDRIVSKRCFQDVDGRPVIAVSHFDVSEFRSVQRKLEAAMQRESIQVDRMREFLQRVIDVIPQEFYIKDGDSRILMVNPVYLRRRGLNSAAEAIGRTAPEIGDAFLTNDPALRENPAAQEEARHELQKSWAVGRAEDLEVLAGRTVLKEVPRWMPGSDAAHTVVIAKAACTDISGRQVIVCASYDITDLRDTMHETERIAPGN